MRLTATLAFFVALTAPCAMATILTGKVVGLADGDTVTLLVDGNSKVKVRLAEIDAPETAKGKKSPGQPFGAQSQQILGAMVHNKMVSVQVVKEADRYGRVVGRISVNGVDIHEPMVLAGLAFVYDDYVTDRKLYGAEKAAYEGRRGVWSQCRQSEAQQACRNRLEKPWQYRKRIKH